MYCLVGASQVKRNPAGGRPDPEPEPADEGLGVVLVSLVLFFVCFGGILELFVEKWLLI